MHAIATSLIKSSNDQQPLCVSLSEVDNVGVAEGDDYDEIGGEIGGDVAEEILTDEDLDEVEDDGTVPFDDVNEEEESFKHMLRVQELRATHRRHDADTGSPEYQVAGMTERISYLTKHLQVHPKDFSTRRGLVALVNKRRRLLNYLCRENEEAYVSLVKSLGIRHKPPSKVRTKEEQYGRFNPQKAVKKHLIKKKK